MCGNILSGIYLHIPHAKLTYSSSRQETEDSSRKMMFGKHYYSLGFAKLVLRRWSWWVSKLTLTARSDYWRGTQEPGLSETGQDGMACKEEWAPSAGSSSLFHVGIIPECVGTCCLLLLPRCFRASRFQGVSRPQWQQNPQASLAVAHIVFGRMSCVFWLADSGYDAQLQKKWATRADYTSAQLHWRAIGRIPGFGLGPLSYGPLHEQTSCHRWLVYNISLSLYQSYAKDYPLELCQGCPESAHKFFLDDKNSFTTFCFYTYRFLVRGGMFGLCCPVWWWLYKLEFELPYRKLWYNLSTQAIAKDLLKVLTNFSMDD